MDSYVYAPKDDYKHRAYWRELYTVEEADHLSSMFSLFSHVATLLISNQKPGLITAAKEHGIVFYYALSPGLDMTYSNPKEVLALKRKLEQVSQFGCDAFALLFDDIESEMSKADKEVFQTFGHAQVSVTNEIYNHLNCSRFLFCPTQYCSTRAMPSVTNSEYLNTIGTKLVQVRPLVEDASARTIHYLVNFPGNRHIVDRIQGHIKAINHGKHTGSNRSTPQAASYMGQFACE